MGSLQERYLKTAKKYDTEMRSLIDTAEHLRIINPNEDGGKVRGKALADFLSERAGLNEKIELTFIPIEAFIFSHPYEIPPGTDPKDIPEFLHSNSRNDITMKINMGNIEGLGTKGAFTVLPRLHVVRGNKVHDSVDAVRLIAPGKIGYQNDLGFIIRTLYELSKIGYERQVSGDAKKKHLEDVSDKIIRERLLRFIQQNNVPKGVTIDQTDNRVHIAAEVLGFREYYFRIFNPSQ